MPRRHGNARQHAGPAGCGQAAGHLDGSAARRCWIDRSIQSSKCVTRKQEEYFAGLLGCRVATTDEYYRSIYSTIRQDATRCSQTLEACCRAVFSAYGRVDWARFLGGLDILNTHGLGRRSQGRELNQVIWAVVPRYRTGTQIQTGEHRLACPLLLAAPSGRGSGRLVAGGKRSIPNSPQPMETPEFHIPGVNLALTTRCVAQFNGQLAHQTELGVISSHEPSSGWRKGPARRLGLWMSGSARNSWRSGCRRHQKG